MNSTEDSDDRLQVTPDLEAADLDRIRQAAGPLVRTQFAEPIGMTEFPPAHFVDAAVDEAGLILAGVTPERDHFQESTARLKREERDLWVRTAGWLTTLAVGVLLPVGYLLDFSTLTIGALSLLLAVGTLAGTNWNSNSELEDSSRSSERLMEPAKQLRIAENQYDLALKRAVEGWLADHLNQELGEVFEPTLPALNPKGLAEVDDPEREIRTEARKELEDMVKSMPGGSIGISGPRGVGKTTLIHRVTTWEDTSEQDAPVRGIVVDAPVEYDAREFVLHVLANLCESVLGKTRVDALRGGQSSPGRSWRTLLRSIQGPFSPKLGLLCLIVGAALFIGAKDAQGGLHIAPETVSTYGIVIGGFGLLIIYFALLLNLRTVAQWARSQLRLRPPKGDPVAIAELHLRKIWFQRSFTSGWSGGLKLPIGLEASTEASAQLAENQLSLPDVIALYKEFVGLLASQEQVRIGIDELDKMEDEQARRFLNEIKALFRIDNCFYFVSVSEDAMAYFERRGLPFREVFDSSFDHVLRVDYLDYEGSRRLLHRRVVGLPAQFISLGHILSGGLARDLIRVTRSICERPPRTPLAELAKLLCEQQLVSKCTAARVAVRRLADPHHVMLLSRWLTQIETASADSANLIDCCRNFGPGFVHPLGDNPDGEGESLKQHREALSIAFEIATFAYFVVTVRESMTSLAGEGAARAAIGTGLIDKLAEARQAFAVNSPEAWEAISAVRTSYLGRDAADFPPL